MNENEFVNKHVSRLGQRGGVVVGPGDDCAVMQFSDSAYQLFAVDQVVSGVHYLNDTPPGRIARKLLNRNVSDIAAMGGWPTQAVLTMALGRDESLGNEWLKPFFEGLEEAAQQWDMSVCGGDVAKTGSEQDVFTLSILGRVEKEKLCLRSAAKSGDLIACTGRLGNSFPSEHHLNFTPRLQEARLLAGDYAKSMIDISDGLVKDLERVAISSNVGAELCLKSLPLRNGATCKNALADGEDYELIVALAAGRLDALLAEWPETYAPLTVIGRFVDDKKGTVFDSEKKQVIQSETLGFDHFYGN